METANEFSTFGVIVLATAAGAALLLASTQITARLPLPAAGFFLTAAAAAANLVPHLREAVSIRTVERLVVVALIVILFDGGLKVGWHRFRRAVLPIGVLGIVGTAGTAALTTVFAHYLVGFHWLLAGVVGAAL
ncbi:MAG: cation:proton antiporter domain-containing protein, partial [Gaiellaceae bacterium]